MDGSIGLALILEITGINIMHHFSLKTFALHVTVLVMTSEQSAATALLFLLRPIPNPASAFTVARASSTAFCMAVSC